MGSLDKVRYAHYPPVKVHAGTGISVDQADITNPIVSFSGGVSSVSGLLDELTSLDTRLDTAEGTLVSLDSRLDTAEPKITALEGNRLRNDQDQAISYFISQNVPFFVGYFSGYTNFNFVSTPNLAPTLNNQNTGGGVTINGATSRINIPSTGLYFFVARLVGIFQTTASGVLYLQLKSSSSVTINQAYGSNPAASFGALDLIVTTLVSLSAGDYVTFNVNGNHGNVDLYTYPHSSVAMWRIK